MTNYMPGEYWLIDTNGGINGGLVKRRGPAPVDGAPVNAFVVSHDVADVDAMFKPHGIVHEEAVRVADDLGLPRWWLNEQASTYISGKEVADKRRVFDHPGLRVMAASPRHIFAMKALAARTRDIDDLRLLADIVGVESPDPALQICANFYPDEPVCPRSAAVLRELFG